MKWHSGILDGEPRWDHIEALVLAHTPGVPLEWIFFALGLGWRRRRQLRAMIHAAENSEFQNLGIENAGSVVQGDGLAMLRAVCPGYAGPAPLWASLELRNDKRSDAAVAAELGVDRKKVWRWRSNAIFDPLTGVRLVPPRGGFPNSW